MKKVMGEVLPILTGNGLYTIYYVNELGIEIPSIQPDKQSV